jgi:hypothetical protein
MVAYGAEATEPALISASRETKVVGFSYPEWEASASPAEKAKMMASLVCVPAAGLATYNHPAAMCWAWPPGQRGSGWALDSGHSCRGCALILRCGGCGRLAWSRTVLSSCCSKPSNSRCGPLDACTSPWPLVS